MWEDTYDFKALHNPLLYSRVKDEYFTGLDFTNITTEWNFPTLALTSASYLGGN